MKIGILHGPNLNRLGRRAPERYGHTTLAELDTMMRELAGRLGAEVDIVQSNHEGVLVDRVHDWIDGDSPADALIVNPASLTPYGRSLAQAVAESGLPCVVVHISAVYRNAPPGRTDLFAGNADAVITGFGIHGYLAAIEHLCRTQTS